MKKTVIITAILLITSLTAAFEGGDGSSSNPYQISTCQQLQEMSPDYGSNGGYTDHYELINNIDCSDTENWNSGSGFDPVGKNPDDSTFNGYLYGNSYSINNLYIDRTTDRAGMFGEIGTGSEVTNISILDAEIHASNSGPSIAGVLVGLSYGEITNTHVTGNLTAESSSDDVYAGGLAGYIRGSNTVSNNHAKVEVSANPTLYSYTGGLFGSIWERSISNSYATGSATTTGGDGTNAAGLVAFNYQGSIDDSYATAKVSASGATDNFEAAFDGTQGGTVSGSYYDSVSTESSDEEATGLTTSEMQGSNAEVNMGAFDFTNTWEAVEASESDTVDDGYPILRSIDREAQLRSQGIYNEPPTASFSSNSPVLTSEDFGLDGSGSSDPESGISSFEWDTDNDGSYEVTGVSPSVSKSDNGDYTIVLRVTDAEGATDTVSETVTVQNRGPSVTLTKNVTTPLTSETVNFDASASDQDGSISSYSWSIGGSGGSVSNSWGDNGSYTVSVTVTDDDGATASDSITVNVQNRPPNALLSSDNSTLLTGETVNFDAGSSGDSDGSISSYDWDTNSDGSFDDGSGSSLSTSFSDDGDYPVSVRVTDDDGASSTDSVSITVQNRGPSVTLTKNVSGPLTGEVVGFDASASDQDGSISSYSWSIGGSGSSTSNSWSDNGSYTVSVTVTDDDGATASDSVTLNVENRAPNADFGFTPPSPVIDEDVEFNASGSSDPDGVISVFEWDWENDGSYEGSGEISNKSYSAPGDYSVVLRVTDDDGENSTVSETVSVTDESDPSVTDFSPSGVVEVDSPEISANFTDNYELRNYSLDLDGSSADSGSLNTGSDSANYSASGLEDGSYSYTWTVEDTSGNTNSVTETFEVDTNSPPFEASLNSPGLSEDGVALNPDLNVSVEDPDGDTLNVSFIDASDGSVVQEETGVSSGEDVVVEWSGLGKNQVYEWYVNVSDGEYVNTSDTFSFRTVVEPEEPDILAPSGGDVVGLDQVLEADVAHPYNEEMFVVMNLSDGDGFVDDYTTYSNNGSVSWSNPSLEYDKSYTLSVEASVNDSKRSIYSSSSMIEFDTVFGPDQLAGLEEENIDPNESLLEFDLDQSVTGVEVFNSTSDSVGFINDPDSSDNLDIPFGLDEDKEYDWSAELSTSSGSKDIDFNFTTITVEIELDEDVDGASIYRIYRSGTSGGDYSAVQKENLDSNGNIIVDSSAGLEEGETYCYRVTAIADSGVESSKSSEECLNSQLTVTVHE